MSASFSSACWSLFRVHRKLPFHASVVHVQGQVKEIKTEEDDWLEKEEAGGKDTERLWHTGSGDCRLHLFTRKETYQEEGEKPNDLQLDRQ